MEVTNLYSPFSHFKIIYAETGLLRLTKHTDTALGKIPRRKPQL